MGGNQWAGGTGGSDTAGLGGRGGPYRLDKGHTVHQVPDHLKESISEEAKKKAREMAKEAMAKRLQELGMTPEEDAMYDRLVQVRGGEERESSIRQSLLSGVCSREPPRILRNFVLCWRRRRVR